MRTAALRAPKKRALVIVRLASDMSKGRLAGTPQDLAMFSPGAVNALDAQQEQNLGNADYQRAYQIYQQAFANWKLNEAQRQGSGLPSAPMPQAPDPAQYSYSNPEINYESYNNNYQPTTVISPSFPAANAQPVAAAPVPTAQYVAPDFSPGAAPLAQQEATYQAQYDAQRQKQNAALDASNQQLVQQQQDYQAQQQKNQAAIDAANQKIKADADAAAALQNQVAATLKKAAADKALADAQINAAQAKTLAAQQSALAAVQSAQAASDQALAQQQAAAQQQQAAAQAQAQAAQAKALTAQQQATVYAQSPAQQSATVSMPVTASSSTTPSGLNTVMNSLTAGGGVFTQPLGNVLPTAVSNALPASVTSTPLYLVAGAAAFVAYIATQHKGTRHR